MKPSKKKVKKMKINDLKVGLKVKVECLCGFPDDYIVLVRYQEREGFYVKKGRFICHSHTSWKEVKRKTSNQ